MTFIKKELRVLMVEDTAPDVVLINHELRKAGLRFRSRRVESREAFLHELEYHTPDIILSDSGVPGFDGLSALAEARRHCPEVPFVFVTGSQEGAPGGGAVKSGADDYVLKSSLHLLGPTVERVLRDTQARVRHRELEQALSNAEEHLRLITAEFKEYAAFMLDSNGRVATWNPGAEHMLGYEPTEILGREFDRIFSEDARAHQRPKQMLAESALNGRIEEIGLRVRKNGESFRARHTVVSVAGSPRREQGFLCVLRDLTPRAPDETVRAARDRASQLEAANRELEEFTHTIALELRPPLRNIESFAEILGKNMGDRLDAKSRGYVQTISDSARRMTRLIDDLFTFSRIGRTDMLRLQLNLVEIVKDVLDDLRPEMEGRTIEWVIGDLPGVDGDPVMIWQVFTNLLSNALKFTRPRAKARIEIGATLSDQDTVVYVRDNGVGFDMHYTHRLFGVFQRLHTKEFEGIGVGLANVRRIVQRHGGRVWAEGAEQEGATFYFALPRG